MHWLAGERGSRESDQVRGETEREVTCKCEDGDSGQQSYRQPDRECYESPRVVIEGHTESAEQAKELEVKGSVLEDNLVIESLPSHEAAKRNKHGALVVVGGEASKHPQVAEVGGDCSRRGEDRAGGGDHARSHVCVRRFSGVAASRERPVSARGAWVHRTEMVAS